MSLLATAREVLDILGEAQVAGCLVGGLAVSSRCDPRFTLDADLAIAVRDNSEAEKATSLLTTRGYRVTLVLDQTATDRLAMVRITEPSGVSINLLFSSSGIEPEIVANAEKLEIVHGLVLPVARVGDLIAMKLLSVEPGRESDAVDLANLAKVATDDDWLRADTAVRLIVSRGYGRGRDLVDDLDRIHREHGHAAAT